MMALQAQQQQQQQQSQGDVSMDAASPPFPPPPPPPSREPSSMVPPAAATPLQQQQQDSSAMDVDEPAEQQQQQQRVQKRQLSPVVPSQSVSSPAARNSSATTAGVTNSVIQSAAAAAVKAQPTSSVTPAVSKPTAANTSTLSGSGSGTKTTSLTAEQRVNAVLKKVFRFTLNKRDPADVYTYVGDSDDITATATDTTAEQLMNVKNLPELLASRLGMSANGEGGGLSYLAKAFTRCHEEMQTALRRSEKVSSML
jgi:hypothetical protein